jgi:hypothetical protein
MRWQVVLVLVGLASFATPGHAAIWKHTRPDGTVEITNVAPRAGATPGAWKAIRSASRTGAAAAAPREVASMPMPRLMTEHGSTVWAREHDDGTMEFTNVSPVGARWKVLFRTGPGKASAVRGASDPVPPRDGSPARFSRYDQTIRDQQEFYGIPQALIRAVIKTESDFDPHVVSSAGAQGLMQLLPSTAKLMGVTDIWDPRQNIMGGARYLQTLAKRFCKTPGGPAGGPDSGQALVCSFEEKIKVVAGYHAGPGAVEKYGGMPPYETTRAYVTTVLQRYEGYRRREPLVADLLSANP